MTMIVDLPMANVSIGGLFLGGIVPGILIGLGLYGRHQAPFAQARVPGTAAHERRVRLPARGEGRL